MSSNTPNLNLLKKNPATDGNDLFDVNTMLNDNWDKIDASYQGLDAGLDNIGFDVSAIKDRLNTAAATSITLKAGLQTITSDRDKPFNLDSIKGRMLLNLLGRAGTFDSRIGWASTGMTTDFNMANTLYGTYCLQITLTGTSARISRTVATTVGKTYFIGVDTRMGTATNARVDVTGISNGNTVTSVSGYQLTYMAFTATATSHNVGVTVTGANGQTAYIDGYRVYEINSTDFGNVSSLTVASASSYYPYTEGLAGVKNPYAIRWSDTARTRAVSVLAFDTELLANPVADSDTDRDILSVGPDGQYIKKSIWNKLALDGTIPWMLQTSSTGYKAAAWLDIPSAVSNTGFVTKYDKTPLSRWLTGNSATSADSHVLDGSTNDLWITISVADSGWGDNYSPSTDEIKAYFYGYKMYDSGTLTAAQAQAATTATYSGSGTKQWANLIGSPVGSSLPTNPASGYTPYEIMYRRSITANVPVPSEGSMSMVQGDNIIEVGTGLIIREFTKPLLYPTTLDRYMINYISGGGNTNPLTYNPSGVLQVYENGRPTTINKGTTTDKGTWKNGVYVDQIDGYNPDKVYSVSYFQADRFPVASITGNTSDNERAILNDLLHDVDYLTRRVAATELRKVDQGALSWTSPTTLNGWAANLGFGYRIEGNRVYLRGILSNGATAAQTLLFTIPARARTNRSFTASFGTYTAAQGQSVAIDFFADGRVQLVTTSSLAQISFEGFSYPID